MTSLPQSVRIREVGPRDGFQNEPEVIATDDKVRLIDALMRTGLRRIEVTSFVRADVIPQLADADEVLARDRPPRRRLGLRADPQRARPARTRSSTTGASRRSTSSCRRRRPTTARTSTARSRSRWSASSACSAAPASEGLRCEAVISVAFGCPYEGHVAPERVLDIAGAARRAPARRRSASATPRGWPTRVQVRAFFEQARDGARRRRRAHRALPQHPRPGPGQRARRARGRHRLLRVLLRRAGRLPGAARAPPATSPPRTSSRCCTRWASRPASTSRRCSSAARAAPRRPRPPAGQPHAGGRRRRLAARPMSRIDELLERARAPGARRPGPRGAMDAGACWSTSAPRASAGATASCPAACSSRATCSSGAATRRSAPRRARGRPRPR